MSRGIQTWTEEAIAKRVKNGHGRGKGPTYLPWVLTTDFYSRGRTHTPYSHKTGRSHELLSDGEMSAFLMLEWALDVVDIREQYPLEREVTLALAQELRIRHPYYPGTHVPFVMTLDFLVTKVSHGTEVLEAFSVKQQSELEDVETLCRLELERSTCQALGVPFRLLVKERMPQQVIANLEWIRDAQLDENAIEPFEGFYEDHKRRMVQDILARQFHGSLNDYCTDYDRRYSVERGTGLRVARMLLLDRTLTMDLNNRAPQAAPMSTFHLTAPPGRLRAMGGN